MDSLKQQALDRDENAEGGDMEEVSNLAQEFYQSLRRHLQTSTIYQGMGFVIWNIIKQFN